MSDFLAKQVQEPNKYTSLEKDIIIKYGHCKATGKILEYYCYKCTELICSVCFYDYHQGHNTIVISKNSEDIYRSLLHFVKEIHNNRTFGLDLRLKHHKKNKEALDDIRDINITLRTFSNLLSSYLKKINKMIETREGEIQDTASNIDLVLNEINERKSQEIDNYNRFYNYLKENSGVKHNIQIFLLDSFIKKNKAQVEHDKLYIDHEIIEKNREVMSIYTEISKKIIKKVIKC